MLNLVADSHVNVSGVTVLLLKSNGHCTNVSLAFKCSKHKQIIAHSTPTRSPCTPCDRAGFFCSSKQHKLNFSPITCSRNSQAREFSSYNVETRKLRILISTGDVMGDIHGGALVRELLRQAEAAGAVVEVVALAGQRTREAGAILIGDRSGLSSIGLLEALPLVLPSLRIQAAARKFLETHPPDAAVLIDYPGVNISFGRYLKEVFGCPVVYYIPPNEWLISTVRTAAIVNLSTLILSNYPAEAAYYREAGGNVEMVGHPLLDSAQQSLSKEQAREVLGVPTGATLVALLPASRPQELRHVWPVIVQAAERMLAKVASAQGRKGIPNELMFVLPEADSSFSETFEAGLATHGLDGCTIRWKGNSNVAMAAADAAISKSGSVTVELALLQVPQVVVYRLDGPTAWIARHVLRFSLPFVSLINILANTAVVPEFIQEKAEPGAIADATMELVRAGSRERAAMMARYEAARGALGGPGAASRAAGSVLQCLGVGI